VLKELDSEYSVAWVTSRLHKVLKEKKDVELLWIVVLFVNKKLFKNIKCGQQV